MKAEKAEVHKKHQNIRAELERKRLAELNNLIEEKKQELINYKNNISLQAQFKTKLKGEKVKDNIYVVHEKTKKKK